LLIDIGSREVSINHQAELLGISRASVYYEPVADEYDLLLKCLIDKQCTLTPFYGSRKITEQLRRDEHIFMAWSMPHFFKNGGSVSRFLAILRAWVVRTVKPTKQTVRKIRTAHTP